MSRIRKIVASIFVGSFTLLAAISVVPMQVSAYVQPECDKSAAFLGLPTWYAYLDVGQETTPNAESVIDKCAITGPEKVNEDGTRELDLVKVIPLVGLAILEILLRLSGVVALFFVVYGGFKYIMSQGEPDKTKQSRQTITNSLIGMVIAIIASAAVSFIANTLTTR